MSSSITIPTRSASKAAATSSSSSSSYSSSPPTPQQSPSSASSSPNTRYGHDRKRSFLSEFPYSCAVPMSLCMRGDGGDVDDLTLPDITSGAWQQNKSTTCYHIENPVMLITLYDRLISLQARTYCDQYWWSRRNPKTGKAAPPLRNAGLMTTSY